jgi:hypothetical protein
MRVGCVGKTSERLIADQEHYEGDFVTNFNQFGRIIALNQADSDRDQKAEPGSRDPPGGRECVMAKKKNRTPNLGRAVADLWLSVTSQLFDSYHPERHYMRGPGPKWRAKHAQPAMTGEPDLGGMANVSA